MKASSIDNYVTSNNFEKKITVITVCLNSVKTIDNTIKSVLNQDYENIEYIVKDGCSTDGTLQILNKYRNKIRIVSKNDSGIYDAMNQGYSLCTGDVVCFLNSDDTYSNHTVLSSVMSVFNQKNIDVLCGNVVFLNSENQGVRTWKSAMGFYGFPNQFPHPAIFLSKRVLSAIGGPFDISYKIAGDLKQQLLIQKKAFAINLIDKTIVNIKLGGVSTKNPLSYLNGWRESRRAFNEVYGNWGGAFIVYKILYKIFNR